MTSDFRDAITASATNRPAKRAPTWLDRVPEDARAELLDIRREWRQGKLQATARGLSASIVENCRERGIPVCTASGVREWLTRGD